MQIQTFKRFTYRLRAVLFSPIWIALFQTYLIGVGAAVTAVLFRKGTSGLSLLRLQMSESLPAWLVLPLMGLLGGAIAGVLIEWVEPNAAGSGFPQLEKYFHNASVPLTWRTAFVKLIGGISAIGSGFPLGAEGPSAYMGASIATQLGKWFSSSQARRRLLTATGAGAGIAAAFNAPLGGFAYALAELKWSFTPKVSIPLSVGMMAAEFWGQVFDYQGLDLLAGSDFAVLYQFELGKISYSLIDVPFLIVLGVLAGLLAPIFDCCILKVQYLMQHQWKLRPTVAIGGAGLAIGIITTFVPQNFQESSVLREAVLEGTLDWRLAAIGLFTTFALTVIAAASRAPGGLFASLLTIGGALGLLVNALSNHWLAYDPPTLMIAGMGAFMSAVKRTPISSTIITFELTKNFVVYHPIVISSVISYLTARQLSRKALFSQM
ncbi:MAG: chloride channel protein [Synechococcus sp.]